MAPSVSNGPSLADLNYVKALMSTQNEWGHAWVSSIPLWQYASAPFKFSTKLELGLYPRWMTVYLGFRNGLAPPASKAVPEMEGGLIGRTGVKD